MLGRRKKDIQEECENPDASSSEILTFIFDMERVLQQPANSLLQPAKKVRI